MLNIISETKTEMRCYVTLTGMARIEKIDNWKCGEAVEKPKLPYTAGENVKFCSHFEKQFGRSSKQ